MPRYIDVNGEIAKIKYVIGEKNRTHTNNAFADEILEMFINALNKAPTADVQEVKHGKWIKKANEIFTYHYVVVCSVCGKEAFYDEVHGYYDDENYCHNCGAKMDGDEK